MLLEGHPRRDRGVGVRGHEALGLRLLHRAQLLQHRARLRVLAGLRIRVDDVVERVQRLIPRLPPRLLGRALGAMERQRFVDWAFGHYLEIAHPRFVAARLPETAPTALAA